MFYNLYISRSTINFWGNKMKKINVLKHGIVVGIAIVLLGAGIVSGLTFSISSEKRDDNLNIYFVSSIGTTHEPTGVYIQNEYGYVCSKEYVQSCPPTLLGALDVFDVFQPESPELLGTCEDFSKPADVFVNNEYAYVLDFPESIHGLSSSIKAIDVTNPLDPWVRYEGDYGDHMAEEVDVFIEGNYAYVSRNGAMDIWPAPELYDLFSSTSTHTYGSDLYVLEDIAYIVSWIVGPRNFLTIVDVSNPFDPEVIDDRMIGGSKCITVTDVEGFGRYAYVGTNSGLQIFNVTDPYNLPGGINYGLSGAIKEIVHDDFYVFCLRGQHGIVALDISNPEDPVPAGYYNTSVNITDIAVQDEYIYIVTDDWTMQILRFSEEDNQPPETPQQPSGPTEGEVGIEYTYSTNSTDPDGDQIYYNFSWDDGEFSGWLGPYDSGQTVEASHIWTEKGSYDVTVQAKDTLNATSYWSEPLTVQITAPDVEIHIHEGFGIGISAEIIILEEITAETIEWSITLNGGLIIIPKNGIKEGSFPTPPVGASEMISTFTFGIGRSEITVSARNVNETAHAFILGPFVYIGSNESMASPPFFNTVIK